MPLALLKKKLSFGWTLWRVAWRLIIAVAFILLFLGIGISNAIGTLWPSPAATVFCFAVSAIFALKLVRDMRKLRADIHVGMREELQRRNHCAACGYDLRFSVDRCPECGKAVPNCDIEV